VTSETSPLPGASNDPNPGQTGAPPPMFYTQPEPVLPATHKDVSIRPEWDFAFAANTNTVPVTVPEFPLVARHYPIMFLGPDLVPTIALGFNPQINLFVNAKGEWTFNHYVPAYIRRYPFILLGAEADDRLTLGIDVAGRSSKPGARPLFEGDKESQTLQQSITLCEQFHGAFVFTREFSAALKASGIVEERPLELEIVPGRPTNVGTFGRVIEEKFKELPDATVLDWYKRGFLYAVYFHLQSMNNWEMMVARNAILMQAASQVA
jgi:hypothetical protein